MTKTVTKTLNKNGFTNCTVKEKTNKKMQPHFTVNCDIDKRNKIVKILENNNFEIFSVQTHIDNINGGRFTRIKGKSK